MKRVLIYISVMLSGITPSFAQPPDAPVNWIHGWGSNPGIWQHYGPIFQTSRRMVSQTPTYNDDWGVGFGASTLTMPASADNILIGHSMGGLVAREYERQFGPGLVRGIATVTSPNQGATVANKIISGNAEQVINRGIDDVTAGPLSEGVNNISLLLPGLTGGLIPPSIAYQITNMAMDQFVREEMFASIHEMMVNMGGSATIQDFEEGGTYITGLNSHTTSVPIVNIICEENDHAALRLGYAMNEEPENAPLHQYDDSPYVTLIDNLEDVYTAYRVFYDIQKFAQPWAYGFYNQMANNWHRGEDYLKSVFEADYNTLIGATRMVPVTTGFWTEVCTPDPSCGENTGRAKECYVNCHYEWQFYETWQVVTTLSDGLLPIWMQRMPGIPDQDVYTAEEVSHAEVGNHENINAAYNLVFNRIDPLGVPLR